MVSSRFSLGRDRMLALIGALDEAVTVLRGGMMVSVEATHSDMAVTEGT